jgi:hypothetical protein
MKYITYPVFIQSGNPWGGLMSTPIPSYYKELIRTMDLVRERSMAHQGEIALAHVAIEDLQSWVRVLTGRPEAFVLSYAALELQYATLSVVTGLYRPAFGSLRLCLELSLATVFYSAHPMALSEWTSAGADLKWGVVNGDQNGALSSRLAKAFFPELLGEVQVERAYLSDVVYKELSQFVHGNAKTWNGLENFAYDGHLQSEWLNLFEKVFKGIMLSLVVRYLKELKGEDLAALEHAVMDRMGHLSAVSQVFARSGHL